MAESSAPVGIPASIVELQPALREDEQVLANLLELYAHDFSEFFRLDLGEDGRFGYNGLSLYWSEPDRHPFLLRVNRKIAGLAFVKRAVQPADQPLTWDMAEFFVLRGFRRHGIGAKAAHLLWRHLPGLWQVRVLHSNAPAYQFWLRTVSSFAGKPVASETFHQGNKDWHVFAFDSSPGSDQKDLPSDQQGLPV